MKRSVSLLSLSLVLGLNGCASWFGKDSWVGEEDSFLQSRMDKPLALPQGVSRAVQEDEYVVPGLGAGAAKGLRGSQLDNHPPQLVFSVGRDVLLDSSAYLPTATFSMSPVTLFEQVNKFLSFREIPVASVDAQAGIILTDWIEHDDSGFFSAFLIGSDPERSRQRFKFSVKTDGESGKGTLVVEQIAAESDSGDGWLAGTPGRDAGVEMLNRYLAWYDEGEQRAARSRVLAEKAGFPLRLAVNSSDVPAFVADAGFQRVWERLPGALEPLGFVVDDKDQSLGAYFLSYEGAPDGGFLDSLAFWSSKPDVEQLDLPEDDYQIKLEELGESTALTMLDEDGKPVPQKQLEKILPALSAAFETSAGDLPKTRRKPE
ncbi:MAG: outer membrane protein assembly factor BamC [Gammaproteobacteria bacterium]|nr:outer membrane protein assembly factor BamC [Gammaproteobacteria bacterium]